MMKPCQNCGDKNWSFIVYDNLIYATCRNCGYEISFTKKEKQRMKTGDICRKCKKGIIIAKQAKKQRVYSGYYFCPECKEMYMSEDFKINKQYGQ